MKITILVSSLTGGGAERIAVEIANNLPETISREIVTILDNPSKYSHSVERISLVKNQGDRIEGTHLLLSLIRYIRYLQKHKPDISLSLLTHSNLLNILACQITKTKPIISVHEMPSQKFTKGINLIRDIVFTLVKYTNSHVVAVSHGVKNELLQMYNIPDEKISVIHNPIDINSISVLSVEPPTDIPIKDAVPYLITVGRLDQVKGQWHLIRAFAELRKRYRCTLLICGDGELREYLTSLAEECGVSEDVVFLGWQENPYQYIAKATIFVQSSLSEALPNVLVESLACGCPAAAANSSFGIQEILGSENACGFISEKMSGIPHAAQDPLDKGEQSLLDYMEILLTDTNLRNTMSIACKERAKQFDLDIGIQKYVDLFKKISLEDISR